MRKLLSLALVAMLVLALVPAVSAADDYVMNENFATTIYVITASCGTAGNGDAAAKLAAFTLKNGDSVSAPNGDFKTGKISYKDGVVTIENCTGIKRIEAYDGSMIINAVGVNTFDNADQGRGFFIDDNGNSKCGDLTITSSTGGVVNISAKQYAIYSRCGNVVVSGDVELNVTCSGIEAIGLGWYNRGAIVFKDDCVCNLTGITNAVHVSKDGLINFEDNANVTVTAPTGSAFNVGGTDLNSAYNFTGNPTVKATSEGTVFNGSGNVTLNYKGGTVEAIGKVALTASVWNIADGATLIAGDDAASAKAATTDGLNLLTYAKITKAAPKAAATTAAAKTATATKTAAAKTADASVVIALVATLALAGTVVCKKKH